MPNVLCVSRGGGELVEQNAVHNKIKKGVMHLHDPF